MKNNKWIWRTLTILLTLVILIGVAGAGFRMGLMQGANMPRFANGETTRLPSFEPMHGFENNFDKQQGRDPHMMQGFGNRGFGRGHGGFFSPLFGFVHLILLGGLIWLGYKLIKNSGWRITHVTQPAPAGSETPSVDEKKE